MAVPKNIALLSDGTGNSAAKPLKTNVWRFYQSIDINPPIPANILGNKPAQIVFYDDGVGTENFKPLAYLGLAFGVGLAKNVKELYTFLCRNYEEHDNIFLIGFSRGAFTVRVLSGLILRCGLVAAKGLAEAELKSRVEHAYDEYKLDVARRATATNRAIVLGWLLGGAEVAHEQERLRFNFDQTFPQISFVGVWDTVDAYGMPIDELKLGIDRYIWPMTLADRKLSKHVLRACQALSLDDERPTFRPVLWDETGMASDHLMQIWFAGVHANVGGGYPDDGLACVALDWIIEEAKARGLWFYDKAMTDVKDAANPHGKQYDSRSGIAGYYRYGPRMVDELCDDSEHAVKAQPPKIYYAAMNRIWERQAPYAPVSFPSDYTMMIEVGTPPTLSEVPRPENDIDLAARVAAMEFARDAVARRRIAYFITVALTILLAFLPLRPWLAAKFQVLLDWIVSWAAWLAQFLSWLAWVADWSFIAGKAVTDAVWYTLMHVPYLAGVLIGVAAVVAWILDTAKGYVWSSLGLWIEWYKIHPLFFLIWGGFLAWLFFAKSASLQGEVFARADEAWRFWRRNPPPPPSARPGPRPRGPNWADRIVRALRKSKPIVAIYRFIARQLVPFLFAVVAVLVGLPVLLLFIPKFVRQILRRRRYRRESGPEDPTPAPRIPPYPFRSQSDALAKDMPEGPKPAEAVKDKTKEPIAEPALG
jgi:uncharacterized protein (DUF2235 family)